MLQGGAVSEERGREERRTFAERQILAVRLRHRVHSSGVGDTDGHDETVAQLVRRQVAAACARTRKDVRSVIHSNICQRRKVQFSVVVILFNLLRW